MKTTRSPMEISDAVWSYASAVSANSQAVTKHHLNGDASGVSAWLSWGVGRLLTWLRAYALGQENGGFAMRKLVTGRSHSVRQFSKCVVPGASPLSFAAIGMRKEDETGVGPT
jgi:hypothetical protein